MKWFAIVALLANVIVFGWQFNEQVRQKAAASAGTPPLPRGTPGLRLVSELRTVPAPRESAREAATDAGGRDQSTVPKVDLTTELNNLGASSDTCISVGPIEDDQHLERVRTWLRSHATAVHTRQETIRQRQLFWVYLEPTSDTEAMDSINDLKRRGVTDYMLIRRGGLKNAISLGLFRSQDSVNRRLAEMTRQGYKPVVVPQFDTVENYWVRATLAEEFADLSIIPEALVGESTLEQVDCSGIADVRAAAGP